MHPFARLKSVTVRVLVLSCALGVPGGFAGASDLSEEKARIQPFSVYDADDKLVGLFYPPFTTQMTFNSKRYSVSLQRNTRVGEMVFEQTLIFYTSEDCSGPAYGNLTPAQTATPFALVNIQGQKVYAYLTEGSYLFNVGVQSYRYPFGECVSGTATLDLYALEPPINITRRYRTPFHVK
jgi:hypothetical protein